MFSTTFGVQGTLNGYFHQNINDGIFNQYTFYIHLVYVCENKVIFWFLVDILVVFFHGYSSERHGSLVHCPTSKTKTSSSFIISCYLLQSSFDRLLCQRPAYEGVAVVRGYLSLPAEAVCRKPDVTSARYITLFLFPVHHSSLLCRHSPVIGRASDQMAGYVEQNRRR